MNLIEIHLPKAPATCDRSLILNKIAETKYELYWFNHEINKPYKTAVYDDLEKALKDFNEHLNNAMVYYSCTIEEVRKLAQKLNFVVRD